MKKFVKGKMRYFASRFDNRNTSISVQRHENHTDTKYEWKIIRNSNTNQKEKDWEWKELIVNL